MVELNQISRASFYRCQSAAPPGPDPDMNLRDAIQRIALEFCSYGRPRITAELKRRGWQVNHKRVHRIPCGRTTCCACGGGSSLSPPIPGTLCGSTRTGRGRWC